MKLNELSDNPGSTKNRMRVGRGIGSGKGKTGGRGVKGQKARTGVAIKGFEGGQMPLHRRLPKRGFYNPFSVDYNEVNIGRIQAAVDAGKLDESAPVTLDALIANHVSPQEQGRAQGAVSGLYSLTNILGPLIAGLAYNFISPGSIFLGFVAIMPAIVRLGGVNTQFAQFYGGTSLLILVGVVLDTLQQIESHLLMRHYDGLMKSGRIKGRSGSY